MSTSLLFQAKYNASCCERDEMREQNLKMQAEMCSLKETLDRSLVSNKIEVRLECLILSLIYFSCYHSWLMFGHDVCVFSQVEVLQDEVVYATEEVERLTRVLDEQNSLLQASQEQAAQKDNLIKNLQQKVKFP